MSLMPRLGLALCSWLAMGAGAAEQTTGVLSSVPSTGAGLQQSLVGLLIVLAVIVGLAWLTRQFRRRVPGSTQQIKVVAQLAVGAKERISLVELADTWIVVGITPTQLNALHVMPKAASTPDLNTGPSQPFAALFDTLRARKPHA